MEDESIKDLKIGKFKLVASAREIFDKAQKDDKGVLNQEQTNSTNKMFDRIKAINASVKLKEQMNEIEKIDVQAVLKDHPATTKNKDIDFMVKALKVGSEQVLNSMQVDSDETGGFLTMPQQISKKLLIEIERLFILENMQRFIVLIVSMALGIFLLMMDSMSQIGQGKFLMLKSQKISN